MSNRLAFQTQLASIMEVLANAAVAEICKLVDDDYAVVSLQMSQCQRENKALKRKLHLLELKMARGNAERRLRESMNGGRARVLLNCNDRHRLTSPSPAGRELHMNVVLWPERTPGDISNLIPTDSQEKSSDVELVEPEQLLLKDEVAEKNVKQEVTLIGDDGVVGVIPHGTTGRRTNQSVRSKGRSNREEQSVKPDLMLVKVELEEAAIGTQIIQEGVVESSTDDNRADLQFNESTQSSVHQLLDVQESCHNFAEISFGRASPWTNGAGAYSQENIFASQPSHSSDPVIETGHATGKSRSSHPSTAFVLPPIIDLCDESNPEQVPEKNSPASFRGQGQNNLPETLTGTDTQLGVHPKRICACRFCGKAFRSPANLESHLRTHTGERPYGCNVCGKKFSQFWNLKIHRNTHTGERPYSCRLCPGRFSDPSNLKKHVKRHHPQM
ncbi:uncharacterized protein ACB057_011125 [Neosynchiropus ocellatus]